MGIFIQYKHCPTAGNIPHYIEATPESVKRYLVHGDNNYLSMSPLFHRTHPTPYGVVLTAIFEESGLTGKRTDLAYCGTEYDYVHRYADEYHTRNAKNAEFIEKFGIEHS